MRNFYLILVFVCFSNYFFSQVDQDSLFAKSEQEVVVVVGSRAVPRTSIDTPLPIDNLDAQSLKTTGQNDLSKSLNYRVPGFNSTSVPVQDASSLLDPYEIRNLGPSRTLVLINGKRKNSSSLIYIQNTLGKGETGADISGIPQNAIDRIEILRDGASAQYGSDAIAGVMNVILKSKINFTEANMYGSVTHKGDGETYGLNALTGSTWDGGFITFAAGFEHANRTERNGNVRAKWDADPVTGFGVTEAEVSNFLKKYPNAGNINGSPDITKANFLINGEIKAGDKGKIYANAEYVQKKVKSFANYRTPYWKSDPDKLLHTDDATYVGFHPTFEGDLTDYSGTLGYKVKTNNEWNVDVSLTTGGNKQNYTVQNTYNESLGKNSPISFKPGGYGFSHIVGNIDVSKSITDNFAVAFGSEYRNESYDIKAGDEDSYSGSGAISFPGIRAANAGNFTRNNIGVYADAAWDITKDFLLNGTIRAEKYSDFGSAFVWKFSSRYKFLDDKIITRASISTGFKAPSLHQINVAIDQATFAGGAIVTEGIANNNSKAARVLGIPKLDAEKALNFTFGLGYKPNKNFSVTLDYYNITIKDRIVLSSRLRGPGTNSSLDQILDEAGVAAVSFFINGIKTNTQGLDLVINYNNINAGNGKLGFSFAGNINHSDLKGSKFNDPAPIAAAGGNLFNRTEKALLLTSRPEFKGTLGIDYSLNWFNVSLNNTLFGPSSFVNSGMPTSNSTAYIANESDLDKLEFDTKMVSDLVFGFKINKNNTIGFSVLNLFNVGPSYSLKNLPAGTDVEQLTNLLDFNGRYDKTAYDSQHISQNGTTFMLNYSVKF